MKPSELSAAISLALLVSVAATPLRAAPPSAEAKPDAAALVREAEDLYLKGAFAEALRRLEAVISSGQETGTVLYEAGSCYRQALGDQAKEIDLKKRAIPLLEKEAASGGAKVDTYYYLAAIYINDLADPVKGTDAAKKGVALLEKSGSPAPGSQDELFRAGRLYTFLGKDKDAARYYDLSVEAAEKAPVVDRASLKLAFESLAAFRFHQKEYDAAARALEGLLKLDPLRDRDRHQLGLAYLLAGKPEQAATAWRAAQEDELRTELTYLSAVVRKYVSLGSPTTSTLAPKPPGLADDDLEKKILQSAGPLRTIREKDAKLQDEANAKAEKEREQKEAERRAARPTDPNIIRQNIARIRASRPPAPPPDPNVVETPANPTTALAMMGIHPVEPPAILPPSPERIAAEKEFFVLLVEYIKRGHLIRNFCFENGLVEFIFR
jgi:hypothetical protein